MFYSRRRKKYNKKKPQASSNRLKRKLSRLKICDGEDVVTYHVNINRFTEDGNRYAKPGQKTITVVVGGKVVSKHSDVVKLRPVKVSLNP